MLLGLLRASVQAQPAAGEAKEDRLVIGLIEKYRDYWRPWINRIEVINDHEIVMHCKNVCLDILFYYSSASNMPIFSKAQWDKEGEMGYETKPAGTGPYIFRERQLDKLDPAMPWTKKEARQAMNKAINREELLKSLIYVLKS